MNDVSYTTENLCFRYNSVPVLRNLHLDFKPGLLHAIVGPNGSGKSTLLDILAGHHTPTSGSVRINQVSLSQHRPESLARLTAMVPQEFSFNFPFTVSDAVLMGRHPHIPRFSRPSSTDMALIETAMNTMDISHLANRPLSTLSGGEKQRTVFARALAQATPGLLLDEPTSSMDIRHTLTAMAELRRLAHDENRTIITVLHDLNMAAAYCDRIVVLHHGQVHAYGTPVAALTPSSIHDVFGVAAEVTTRTASGVLTITYESKE